ncbi:MAG: tRNA guanosine(34) transglycosylase Tgt [Actinobacteria bacterium]|nr:MAG: tRNA guanosine(34) transglycosylase Tgt [Actinomycetota bacterium]RIK05645.1 MAG: tRNA guanosine(34) transglycosylase Tgt [Acidobacteriota bacterium]
MKLTLDVAATDGAARVGWVDTKRGGFSTPCFMPVGTRGTVRTVSSADMEELGCEFVLANTYHLMLRPGVEIVAGLGGLHSFMGWNDHILTDSGGYQVFSLAPEVDDEGVSFRSTYDGSLQRLTPTTAVTIQEELGADIQMALDICPPLPSPRQQVQQAVERTSRWAAEARAAHRRTEDQSLFGIVQGGVDCELRRWSARRTVDLDFDGYAIGGLSVGESRSEMLPALRATLELLPPDQPRYLMGVGDPVGLVEAVSLGVDLFDCVLPTRLGRHGTLLTGSGRMNIRRADYAGDDRPIDPDCRCPACVRFSRGYLRHLALVKEPTAARLFTLHNLSWVLGLVTRIRSAIRDGRLGELRRELNETWR